MSTKTWRDYEPGDQVLIHYLAQPDIEAVVIESPRRTGFMLVEQEYKGMPVRFDAFAGYCEPR